MSRRSLGEAFSLCRGAARGAGMQWGMADECGRAAQWFLRAGLPLAPLASALEEQGRLGAPIPESRPLCASDGGAMCPLAAGALLCDERRALMRDGGRELGRVGWPVLLGGFLGRVEEGFLLEWEGARFFLSGGRVWTAGGTGALLAGEVERVGVRLAEGAEGGMVAPGFGLPDEGVWGRFLVLAARTYVPSGAVSRARGAGAGVTDND